jgi:hypothetical protein
LIVPNSVPTQLGNSVENGILGRVNIARGNCDRGMAGDPRQRPNVATGLPQPREECMPQRIENERTDLFLVSLRRFLSKRPERLGVLFS